MFEFLTGKLSVNIDKFNFSFGESFEGSVALKLRKPLKAKALNVSLFCEHESGSGKNHSVRKVYDFVVPLDGEKEYSSEEKTFKFKFVVPKSDPGADAMKDALKAMPEMLGKMLNTLVVSGVRKNWYIEARLDIPWAVDVTKKVRITVQ